MQKSLSKNIYFALDVEKTHALEWRVAYVATRGLFLCLFFEFWSNINIALECADQQFAKKVPTLFDLYMTS